ncbi:MAG: squalene/phytoene synthase family protein [Chloroflexi bacterium]|nr:squalene/phytoene synthase family protein [Chloroflexota bacterium]
MSISDTRGPLPNLAPKEKKLLLTGLLKNVSRAFYLTLRVLPKDLREPVGLAYLLARAGDTIADTRLLPPKERLRHLLEFRRQVDGPASIAGLRSIGDALTDRQSIPAERELLQSLHIAFAVLEAMDEPDRRLVRSIVVKLTRGMEMDLETFPPEESGTVAAFKDGDRLDEYVYLVAGCVGEFWTSMTMRHTASLSDWDETEMSALGVGFGKALQMTNVLRDVPRDLRIGRCYLPQSDLDELGLSPSDLLEAALAPTARPALVRGIETALEHYRRAEEYIVALPGRNMRLRLATLWPVLIGLATLGMVAREESWLDPGRTSRVSRKWVYRMMATSLLRVHSNSAIRRWIGRLRSDVQRAL